MQWKLEVHIPAHIRKNWKPPAKVYVYLGICYIKWNPNKIKLKSWFTSTIQICISTFLEYSFHDVRVLDSISLCENKEHRGREHPHIRKMGFLYNRIKAKQLSYFLILVLFFVWIFSGLFLLLFLFISLCCFWLVPWGVWDSLINLHKDKHSSNRVSSLYIYIFF